MGSCLKAEADECRVVPNPTVCYATYSGDLGPLLWALGASVHLMGPKGERRLSMAEFFVPPGLKASGNGNAAHTMDDGEHLDGIGRNGKQADEIIVAVEIPEEALPAYGRATGSCAHARRWTFPTLGWPSPCVSTARGSSKNCA